MDKNVFDSDEDIFKQNKPIIDIPWVDKHKVEDSVVENPKLSNYKRMPVT